MSTDGNGNGENDDGDEHRQDESRQNFGHPSNYPLLCIMANWVIEQRHHTVRLRYIYDELRMLPFPASGAWGEKLLEEQERHYKATGENLLELKRHVRKESP